MSEEAGQVVVVFSSNLTIFRPLRLDALDHNKGQGPSRSSLLRIFLLDNRIAAETSVKCPSFSLAAAPRAPWASPVATLAHTATPMILEESSP